MTFDDWQAGEAAVARLEEVLHGLPYDRALPDIADVLRRADVGPELLSSDERAAKMLHEAVVARPFGTLDEAAAGRLEAEVLTLEVGLLSDVLRAERAAPDELAAARDRLAAIRARLGELDDRL